MSLYDRYNSDINVDYMYNLVNEIIKKNTNEEIIKNEEFKKIFKKNSLQIFNETNTEDIEILNKKLLENHVELFTGMLNLNKPPEPFKKKDENANLDDRYNDLMENRNLPLNVQIEENKNTPLRNTNVELDNPEFVDNYQQYETKIDDLFEVQPHTEKIEEKIVKEVYSPPEIKIFSSKRNNIQSSRYLYNYNLKKNNILASDLRKISRLIIPVEDNYIFTLPILFLTIKELNYDITMELDHIIEKDNRKFGYYNTIENKIIKENKIEKITIDIRDITETKYDMVDIAKVNIVVLKNNEIHFTCTNIERNNFLKGDYIKIINNYTKEFNNINYPIKIINIEKNVIICDFNTTKTKTYTDIDMKLLNTSNQNIIFFN